MGATYLGYETKTANGGITIPTDCNYVAAFVTGSELPPWINGIQMETKATVPAQGYNKAISLHVLPVSLNEIVPFIMEGDSVTFIYIQNGVCTRPVVVKGYSAAGSVGGTLPSGTDDLVVGMVLGNNGQVTITTDGNALTLVEDSMTTRIGYRVPGDSSQTIATTDPGTTSGYWYTPPPIWHDTTTSVLITPGHYETTPVYHDYRSIYLYYNAPNYWYGRYLYSEPGDPNYITGLVNLNDNFGLPYYDGAINISSVFYTYVQTWIPPVYETQQSGYWEYPPQQWVVTGTPGNVSAIVASIADTMIGGIFVPKVIIA